jgi:DNA-directed RNA polymerase subunit beta'
VWDALDVIIKDHPVLLNRAPTLHRLGIQAFEPVLVEGRAIKLHPLVCTAFNADFDGDQMAVHVPLSAEAQAEARMLMLSANNLLRPQDGGPVTVPTQDMVLGSYYLTEAMMAYNEHVIGPHCPIGVRVTRIGSDGQRVEQDGTQRDPDCGDFRRTDHLQPQHPPESGLCGPQRRRQRLFEYEITFQCGKKQLGKIVDRTIRLHGFTVAAEVLDNIKATGYKYSTRGAITVSIADMTVPPAKYELVAKTEQRVLDIENQYKMGFMTNQERYKQVVCEWEKTTNEVSDALQKNLDRYNPIYMMADSGARGSMKQIRQLAGMRGLMANTAGRTIEIPIKANYREGLTALEYFISSRGARKGLADTALRTADSGYLTRRLVDVSQDVIIREQDCGVTHGITVSEISENGQVIEKFAERILGRYPVHDILDPKTGEVWCTGSQMITCDADVEDHRTPASTELEIRTVLTCRAHSGVCAKCYGMNLATRQPVGPGEAVGIIAAQSIGEPGTQLTMRTFHTGGVAGGDITQGLPRVEELFEARKPKKMAQIARSAARSNSRRPARAAC